MGRNWNWTEMVENTYRGIVNKEGQGFLRAVCPSFYGQECRLCSILRETLNQKPDEATKKKCYDYGFVWSRGPQFPPGAPFIYFSNILFAATANQVRIFEYGFKIMEQLIAYLAPDSDLQDFMNIQTGRPIAVTKKGKGLEGTSYTCQPRMKVMSVSPQIKLYDLTHVPEWLGDEKFKTVFVRQTQLSAGTTDIRFLPHWEDIACQTHIGRVFFIAIPFHKGISDEDLQKVQRGEYNPIVTAFEPPQTEDDSEGDVPMFTPPSGFIMPPAETAGDQTGPAPVTFPEVPTPTAIEPLFQVETVSKVPSVADVTPPPAQPTLQGPQPGKVPPCFGDPEQFDSGSPICMQQCSINQQCGELAAKRSSQGAAQADRLEAARRALNQ